MKNLELCYGNECHDKIIEAIKNNRVIITDLQNLMLLQNIKQFGAINDGI